MQGIYNLARPLKQMLHVPLPNRYPGREGASVVELFSVTIPQIEVGDTVRFTCFDNYAQKCKVTDENIAEVGVLIDAATKLDLPITAAVEPAHPVSVAALSYAHSRPEGWIRDQYDKAWEERRPVSVQVFGHALQVLQAETEDQ